VTVAAVASVGKSSRLKEISPFGGGVSRQRDLVFRKGEIVSLPDHVRVDLACCGLLRPWIVSAIDSPKANDGSCSKCQKKDNDASAKDLHTVYGWRPFTESCSAKGHSIQHLNYSEWIQRLYIDRTVDQIGANRRY
jgi:hypothetical protein